VTTHVLGVDPGQQTGVALLRVGPQAPLRVERQAAIADRDFPRWVRDCLQTTAIDVVVVESWLGYSGPRGRKGAAQTAYAVGRVIGALEALGVPEVIQMPRPSILAALGLKSNASKEQCQHMVALLTTQSGEMNQHVADAIAAGIAGSGRAKIAT
jgi:Holliday junction resolvasome RuvABC endonuclease subunit